MERSDGEGRARLGGRGVEVRPGFEPGVGFESDGGEGSKAIQPLGSKVGVEELVKEDRQCYTMPVSAI